MSTCISRGKIFQKKIYFTQKQATGPSFAAWCLLRGRIFFPDEHGRDQLAKIGNFRFLAPNFEKKFRKQSGERSGEGGAGRLACQTYTR